MTTYESKGFIHGAFYQSSNYECTSNNEAFEEQDVEMFTYFTNPKTGHLDFKPKKTLNTNPAKYHCTLPDFRYF